MLEFEPQPDETGVNPNASDTNPSERTRKRLIWKTIIVEGLFVLIGCVWLVSRFLGAAQVEEQFLRLSLVSVSVVDLSRAHTCRTLEPENRFYHYGFYASIGFFILVAVVVGAALVFA